MHATLGKRERVSGEYLQVGGLSGPGSKLTSEQYTQTYIRVLHPITKRTGAHNGRGMR